MGARKMHEQRRQERRAEAARVEAVRRFGDVSGECSGEIAPAPARGPVKPYREIKMVAVGTDGFERVPERYQSGAPGMVRDAFDAITDAAKRGGGGAPFTAAQVGAGRDYAALTERVAAAGVKGSSVFDVKVSGSGRDFMDAYLADAQRLGWFHAAIGDGIAKDVRRKVPARAGRVIIGEVELRAVGRRLITVRALVDAVCTGGASFADVLRAHGWTPTGKARAVLRDALCAALDRMQGI